MPTWAFLGPEEGSSFHLNPPPPKIRQYVRPYSRGLNNIPFGPLMDAYLEEERRKRGLVAS